MPWQMKVWDSSSKFVCFLRAHCTTPTQTMHLVFSWKFPTKFSHCSSIQIWSLKWVAFNEFVPSSQRLDPDVQLSRASWRLEIPVLSVVDVKIFSKKNKVTFKVTIMLWCFVYYISIRLVSWNIFFPINQFHSKWLTNNVYNQYRSMIHPTQKHIARYLPPKFNSLPLKPGTYMVTIVGTNHPFSGLFVIKLPGCKPQIRNTSVAKEPT